MTIITPQHTVYYDPLGLMDDNHKATVFYRTDVAWGANGRPAVFFLDGGGWINGSGRAVDSLDTDINTFAIRCYERGLAVVSVGYSTNAAPPTTQYAFDWESWKQSNGHLRIDPTKLSIRHSEKDFVNFLQYFRLNGIGDLDTRDGEGWTWSKSAGHITTSFCVFGPNRADPAATPGTRYAMNTRLKGQISRSSLATWRGWLYSTVVQHHLNDAKTAINTTSGDLFTNPAFAAKGLTSARYDSPLWYANNITEIKDLNAVTPVHMANAAPIEWPGPYGFNDMANVLSDPHPSESTLGMRDLLLALDAEYASTFHADNSVFLAEHGYTEDELTDLEYTWLMGQLGISEAVPEVETGEEKVIRFLKERLEGITSANGYMTDVQQVVRVDEYQPAHLQSPFILVAELSTDYDHNASFGLVEGEMTVLLELNLSSFDNLQPNVSKFVADVQNRLADVTLIGDGTVVYDLTWSRAERFIRGGAHPRGGASMRISLRFRLDRSDAYVLANCS